jgi:hypothetical protein
MSPSGTGDPTIHAEALFEITRRRYPLLEELVNEAEMVVPALRALARQWWRQHVEPLLPVQPTGQTLLLRVGLFAVLATERAVQLAEAIAREVEADSLFGSAAVARSQLETIGLTIYAYEELQRIVSDPGALEPLTARLLLSSRSLPTQDRHFATRDLIAAAKNQLGDHFGNDYGLLSDLVHPNALLVWGSERLERASSEARSVTEAEAELLVKVAGQGLRAVGHNALNLLDWALEHDTFLVPRVEPSK